MTDTPAPAETIAAVATAPGRGGIGIVRVSGPAALRTAHKLTGKTPAPRAAVFTRFRDDNGDLIDSGITLYFPGPASFTGEDVVEFHCHGGIVVLDMILERTLALGARLAQPGEFSERAYLNGKIDLAQAEAIADLIDSASREAARGAIRSLEGEFSAKIDGLVDALTTLRILVEASIDFPEEDVSLVEDYDAIARIDELLDCVTDIETRARTGRLLRDGINVLIAGKPNAGKSSLLNALAGSSVAIVSSMAGTTRDLVRERILIDGIPVHITDTAGLRDSPDDIEREGMRRAMTEAESTDVLLLVIDSAAGEDPDAILATHFSGLADRLPAVCVALNKCDLSGIRPGVHASDGTLRVALSALSGDGIEDLKRVIRERAAGSTMSAGTFTARRRHLDALAKGRTALQQAKATLTSRAGTELVAEDLRLAQTSFGEITGHISSDELLGRIFSSFCIGK